MSIDVNKMKSYKKNVDTEVNQFLNSSDEDKAKNYSSLSPELKALIDPIIQEEQTQQVAPQAPAPTQAPVQESPHASLENPLYNYPDRAETNSKLFLSLPMDQQTANYANLPADTKALVDRKLTAQQETESSQAPLVQPPEKSNYTDQVNTNISQKPVSNARSLLNEGLTQGRQGIQGYYNALTKEEELKASAAKEEQELMVQQENDLVNIANEAETKKAEVKQQREASRQQWLNTSVDQNRIFKNQSTNQRVMTGLGVFLGSLSNALTGQTDVSKNPALMAIDRAIENDIRSQELDMAKMKDNVNLKTNELAELTSEYGDKEKAKLELYARKKGAIGLKIQQLVGKNASLKNNALAQQSMAKYLGEASKDTAALDLNDSKIIENQAKAKADSLTNKINPVQLEVDKKYAQDYNDFTTKAGARSKKTINDLKEFQRQLEAEDKEFFQSGGSKVAPWLNDGLRDEQSILWKTQIPGKAFSVLKELFPGAISNEERTALAETYYNDRLKPKANAEILKTKIAELENTLNAELEKSNYFQKYQTLEGFKAKLPVSNEEKKTNINFKPKQPK